MAKEYFYLLKTYLKRFVMVDVESNKLLFSHDLETVISNALEISLPGNLLTYSVFYLSQNVSP